jgi:hypothetical protein
MTDAIQNMLHRPIHSCRIG